MNQTQTSAYVQSGYTTGQRMDNNNSLQRSENISYISTSIPFTRRKSCCQDPLSACLYFFCFFLTSIGLIILFFTIWTVMTEQGAYNYYNFTNGNETAIFHDYSEICGNKFFLERISGNYHFSNDTETCVPNECTCRNGKSLNPGYCPKHMKETCVSCEKGYELVKFQENGPSYCLPTSDSSLNPKQKLQQACRFDLTILLDGSASVHKNHFKKAINFARNLTDHFVISSEAVQVTVGQFSMDIKLYGTKMNETFLVNSAFNELGAGQLKQGTNTNAGLEIFKDLAEKNPQNPPIFNYLVLETDGLGNVLADPTIINAIHDMSNTKVFALGVSAANLEELQKIASDPDEKYMYFAEEYEALENMVDVIVNDRLYYDLCKMDFWK